MQAFQVKVRTSDGIKALPIMALNGRNAALEASKHGLVISCRLDFSVEDTGAGFTIRGADGKIMVMTYAGTVEYCDAEPGTPEYDKLRAHGMRRTSMEPPGC